MVIQAPILKVRLSAYVRPPNSDGHLKPVDLCVCAATEAAKESVMNATTDETGRPELPTRVISPKHFEHALTQVSRSTRPSSDLDRWHKSFSRRPSVKENVHGSKKTKYTGI